MRQESHFNVYLFWLAIIAVMAAQFALCHEAMVCRGYPPLTEIGLYKILASPCLIWFPAVFGTRVLRFWGLVVLSVFTTLLFVMISLNGRCIPSIGHLAGVMGIIRFYGAEIAINTLLGFPITWAIMYFPERVFGDLWRALFALPTENMTLAETWQAAWKLPTRRKRDAYRTNE